MALACSFCRERAIADFLQAQWLLLKFRKQSLESSFLERHSTISNCTKGAQDSFECLIMNWSKPPSAEEYIIDFEIAVTFIGDALQESTTVSPIIVLNSTSRRLGLRISKHVASPVYFPASFRHRFN